MGVLGPAPMSLEKPQVCDVWGQGTKMTQHQCFLCWLFSEPCWGNFNTEVQSPLRILSLQVQGWLELCLFNNGPRWFWCSPWSQALGLRTSDLKNKGQWEVKKVQEASRNQRGGEGGSQGINVWQPALPSSSPFPIFHRTETTLLSYPPSCLHLGVWSLVLRAPNLARHMQRGATFGFRKTLFSPTKAWLPRPLSPCGSRKPKEHFQSKQWLACSR